LIFTLQTVEAGFCEENKYCFYIAYTRKYGTNYIITLSVLFIIYSFQTTFVILLFISGVLESKQKTRWLLEFNYYCFFLIYNLLSIYWLLDKHYFFPSLKIKLLCFHVLSKVKVFWFQDYFLYYEFLESLLVLKARIWFISNQ
jgi:hypothetical protein